MLVAGAGGGGIGTAVCRVLAEAGAGVVAVDNDPNGLALATQVIADAGGQSLPLLVDVRDEEEMARAVDEAVERFGSLHGLVHVVGGQPVERWEPLLAGSLAHFEDVLRLNLYSAVVTSQTVARTLVAGASGGSIVYISSIVAMQGMPFGAGYAAAKAGLLALTRTAALEWGSSGVRVNAVAAGTIRTARNQAQAPPEDTAVEQAAIPLGRRGRPDDIAGAVLYLLSDLAGFMTGQVLVVDGGSSIRPSYLDEENLPVFVHDEELRKRLRDLR